MSTKNRYSNAIISNYEGAILFLKRNKADKFEPNTWCLPGGGVDEGEDPKDACIREVMEETHLPVRSCDLLGKIKVEGAELFYFVVVADIESDIILNNRENVQYDWMQNDEWSEANLILDLKQHLKDLLSLTSDEEAIEKGYKEDIADIAEKEEQKRNMIEDERIDLALNRLIVPNSGKEIDLDKLL